MKSINYAILIALITCISCSSPEAYKVDKVIDGKTLVLTNGAKVRLLDDKYTEQKITMSSIDIKDSYVYLYDEYQNAIDNIYENDISAFVYDENGYNIMAIDKIVATNNNNRHNDSKTRTNHSTNLNSGYANSLSSLYEDNKKRVFLVAVVQDEESYSQGSGFFLADYGLGISNYHVFKGGLVGQACIKDIDGNVYDVGDILIKNEELDYIIFNIQNPNNVVFPSVKIASTSPKVGEEVFAIGNPKGLEHTLSKGIVSSYRSDDYQIQTTAEITHGSSGGPLFNMNGEVVGITTSGLGEANINFAMNILKLQIDLYINNEQY